MMNAILNFLCSIPESIGWTLVAIEGAILLFMLHKLGKLFVEMWKEHHEDDSETESECE